MGSRPGSATTTIVGGIAVVSLLLAGFVTLGRWKPTRATAAAASSSAPARPASPPFKLGEIVTVKRDLANFTLAATLDVAVTAERLELAGDREGFRQLLASELILGGTPGEHVRIIGFNADPAATERLGSTATWVQARFVDGLYEGRAGWVDAAFLTR